ncbi:MAG: hypothetical protein IJ785_02295 [Bacteroidales bacterium]|nr:hypothetical protein [Bacteroidales bacterium]
MKTTSFRNAAFFLLVTIATCATAQPLGNTISFNSEHGNNLLVRAFHPGNDLVYEYNTDLNRHALLCQHPNMLGYYLRYQFPLMANYYGTVDYTVTDMKVVGNVCFFCGTMTEMTANPVVPIGRTADTKSTGYIGRIALDSMVYSLIIGHDNEQPDMPRSGGLNIKLSLFKVKKTSSVVKMAVDIRGADTLIALAGQTDSSISMPCIVLVKRAAVPSNSKTHFYSIDNHTEHFTDVAIGHNSIFTVSRFDGQHTSFGLRSSNKLNAFTPDFIYEFQNLYTVDAGAMHQLSNPVSYTWHPDDAEIHLVAAPRSNEVTVAYEGRKFNNPNDSSNFSEMVNLFWLSASSAGIFSMTDAKTSGCHSATEPYLIEAQAVGNSDTIALLASINDAQYIQSELILFRWGATSHPLFANYQQPASGMDVTPGRMSIVGQLPSGGSPFLYCDDPHLTSIDLPCYWQNPFTPVPLTPMAVPVHSQSRIVGYAYDLDLYTHFRVTPTAHIRQTICTDGRSAPTE